MNNNRKDFKFEIGDRVFFKVSSQKRMIKQQKGGKLNPKYVELFEITQCIRTVAYKLDLPANLSKMHNIFDVS